MEEAAARDSRPVEKRVLRKWAREAGKAHLVKCCLLPGKRKVKREPLKELYIDDSFFEHQDEWNKELVDLVLHARARMQREQSKRIGEQSDERDD